MSTRPSSGPAPDRGNRMWDRGSDAIGASLTFAVAVALFAWLGYLADGRVGTTPLFLIIGVALGLVGGFIHLLRVLAPDLLPFGRGRRRTGGSADEVPDTDGPDDPS